MLKSGGLGAPGPVAACTGARDSGLKREKLPSDSCSSPMPGSCAGQATLFALEPGLELGLELAEAGGVEVLLAHDLLDAVAGVGLVGVEDVLEEEREAALFELEQLLRPVEVVADFGGALEGDHEVAHQGQEVLQVGAALLAEELRVPHRAPGHPPAFVREVADHVALARRQAALGGRRARVEGDVQEVLEHHVVELGVEAQVLDFEPARVADEARLQVRNGDQNAFDVRAQVVEENRELVGVQLAEGLRVALGDRFDFDLRARSLDHVVDVPVVVHAQVRRVGDFVQDFLDLLEPPGRDPPAPLVHQVHLVQAAPAGLVRNARVGQRARRGAGHLLVVRVVVAQVHRLFGPAEFGLVCG